MPTKEQVLQRYMSSSDKKPKKKKKKTSKTNIVVHDEDHSWDPKSLEKVKRRWDRDVVDDNAPTIVDDLPICANPEMLEEYMNANKSTSSAREKDSSPPRRRSEDASPPRKRRSVPSPTLDASPPRRRSKEDASPPRRRRRTESDDTSPPRRRRRTGLDDDASPPRRKDKDVSPPRRRRKEEKTASGHRAGLQTGAEFGKQERRIREESHKAIKEATENGSEAPETVYRDRKGRKLDMLNEMMRQRELQEGKKVREAREEYEWGTGSVQKKDRLNAMEEMKSIEKAPFSRFQNDPQLERVRKEQIRADDPMQSQAFARVSGEEVQSTGNATASGYPKYKGPPAPTNRFGIPPGYRWDGVVRGTNWEEKVLKLKNQKKATREDAYKWSVAEM